MVIVFKEYDKNNKLDMFNKKLSKVSKGRFELRKNKRGVYYLYDYDWNELVRNKLEVEGILDVMHLSKEFKELEV